MDAHIPRLKQLRYSHCDSCGCARCKRINKELARLNEPPAMHTGSDDTWLIEGMLTQQGEQWFVRDTEEDHLLDDLLDPWQGHEIVILVGKAHSDG